MFTTVSDRRLKLPKPEIQNVKVRRVVEQARALGLVVEFESRDYGIEAFVSEHAVIRRPHWDAPNLLAQVYNSEFLTVHGLKSKGTKMFATRYGFCDTGKRVKQAHIKYILERWAEDVAEHIHPQAA